MTTSTLFSVSGCSQRWTCCGASLDEGPGGQGCSPRHSCCGSELGGRGCRRVCRKCGEDWGTGAKDCFVRDHNLVSIESLHEQADHQPGEAQEQGGDERTQFIPAAKVKVTSRRKKLQKVTELLEKYPQIITYHMI